MGRVPVVYPTFGWLEIADELDAVGDGALAQAIRVAMDGQRRDVRLDRGRTSAGGGGITASTGVISSSWTRVATGTVRIVDKMFPVG